MADYVRVASEADPVQGESRDENNNGGRFQSCPMPEYWCCSRLAQRVRRYVRSLPLAILVLYFTNTVAETLPDTAMMTIILEEIKMPLATSNDYFGFIYLPFFLKPIYAWISDRFPICRARRRPWIIIGNIVACGLFLITASSSLVSTIPVIFAASFTRTLFEDLAEVTVGVSFVEYIEEHNLSISQMQSLATLSRYLGQIFALLISLYLYPCRSTASSGGPLSPRGILALTALFPAINVITAAFFFSEPKKYNDQSLFDATARRMEAAAQQDPSLVVNLHPDDHQNQHEQQQKQRGYLSSVIEGGGGEELCSDGGNDDDDDAVASRLLNDDDNGERKRIYPSSKYPQQDRPLGSDSLPSPPSNTTYNPAPTHSHGQNETSARRSSTPIVTTTRRSARVPPQPPLSISPYPTQRNERYVILALLAFAAPCVWLGCRQIIAPKIWIPIMSVLAPVGLGLSVVFAHWAAKSAYEQHERDRRLQFRPIPSVESNIRENDETTVIPGEGGGSPYFYPSPKRRIISDETAVVGEADRGEGGEKHGAALPLIKEGGEEKAAVTHDDDDGGEEETKKHKEKKSETKKTLASIIREKGGGNSSTAGYRALSPDRSPHSGLDDKLNEHGNDADGGRRRTNDHINSNNNNNNYDDDDDDDDGDHPAAYVGINLRPEATPVEEGGGGGGGGESGGGLLWTMRKHKAMIWPGIALFLYNAAPSATAQLATYQFAALQAKACVLVHMRLISSVFTGLSCLLYPRLVPSGREGTTLTTRYGLVTSGLLSILSTFMYLPLTSRRNSTGSSCVDIQLTCLQEETYFGITSALSGMVTGLALLPLLVIATQTSPNGKRKGLFYSVYLSLLDLGSSIGDWATTPIIQALQIRYGDYGHSLTTGLSLLIFICGAARLFSLVVVYLMLGKSA